MNVETYSEYINASLSKGTIGSYISVGLFAFVGLCLLSGIYFGAKRGFSKSVIRIFTVGASAFLAFFAVNGISKLIVDNAVKTSDGGAKKLDALLESFFPGVVESMPDIAKPIISEIDSKTATVFVMMIVAVILSPILLISIFYILKSLSVLIYQLLAGLAGAISYGKGIISTILGAAVGLIQGFLIAAIVIFPIHGLCGVASDAREHLVGSGDDSNEYIKTAYVTVIDDLADNPLFGIAEALGADYLYEDMITVKINDEKIDMGEKCVAAVKVVADMLPIMEEDFDYAHPTETQRESFHNVVVDIGDDEMVAALAADIMRGVSAAERGGKIDLGLQEATKALVDDVMLMFSTSTQDTIQGDLDIVLEVYLLMCDRHLFDSFSDGHHRDMRELLAEKDENGVTNADAIISKLNEYERAHIIVTSFTKISLAVMHGSEDFHEEADKLYEAVKEDVSTALTHNKSDYATEEEYRSAVTADLDNALINNNISVSEQVKENMVNYISDNYGDYEGEITEKEVNDALLSYYRAYSQSQSNADAPDEGVTDGGAE